MPTNWSNKKKKKKKNCAQIKFTIQLFNLRHEYT